jgi:dTDP-4-dehydrorhamnose 3,5-epimerase-like enzyme
MKPELILGGKFEDERGILFYNNDFDASLIKRIYFIENTSTTFERGWQGHKIEERWFIAVCGTIKISLIKIDDWETPSHDIESKTFELNQDAYKVLHVPSGYVSCIQTMTNDAKLMVMSNYKLGEIKDEYRFPLETFKRK